MPAAPHRYHVDGAESLARERERTLGFRHGGGEVDDEDVETARLLVERLEELRRHVGS